MLFHMVFTQGRYETIILLLIPPGSRVGLCATANGAPRYIMYEARLRFGDIHESAENPIVTADKNIN